MNQIGKKTLLSITLFALLISGAALSAPVYAQTPHPADSIWIEPKYPGPFGSSTAIGTKFNVTIWLNMTTPANNYQWYLAYNNTLMNATRVDYTGNGKSMWSESLPVDTVLPAFGNHNDTFSYVLHGEVLKASANQTGAGSLSWVEFNITKVPPAGTTWSSLMTLSETSGPFSTNVYNAAFETITVTYDDAVYTIPEFPLSAMLSILFAATMLLAISPVRRKLKL